MLIRTPAKEGMFVPPVQRSRKGPAHVKSCLIDCIGLDVNSSLNLSLKVNL